MGEKNNLIIGVLALQGGFSKHMDMLNALGASACEVRYPDELAKCHGLIIPGGESTVMSKQIDFMQFTNSLKSFAINKPIFGTCAGLILISQEILHSPLIPLGLIDVSVERNAFGRQIDSFVGPISCDSSISTNGTISTLFIRAPRIKQCGADVKILASYQEEPVLVQQGIHIGATFHPELTNDTCIHAYFLKLVAKQIKK